MRRKSEEMTNQQNHECEIDRSLYPELYSEDSMKWEEYANGESQYDLDAIPSESGYTFTDAEMEVVDQFNEVTEDDLRKMIAMNYTWGNRRFSALPYYMIGKEIDLYFKGTYGESELQHIADLTGIGVKTLKNACKFYRLFPIERFRLLFTGPFPPEWYQISNNLSVHPDRLIEIYRKSKNRWDFDLRIYKLKHPHKKRS